MSVQYDSSKSILETFLRKEVFLLKISGISLTGNESTMYKVYSFIILLLNYTYPFVQLAGALLKPDEVDSDTIYCNLGIYLILAKMSVMQRRRVQIRETLLKLGRKPFIVNLDRGGHVEEKLFEECVWITTAQTRVYLASLGSILFATATLTMANRLTNNDYHNWKMPFGKMLTFNVTASPKFEIVWLYQMLSVSCLCSCLTASDLITFFVLCRVCYQFKFLQNNLRRMVTNSYVKLIMSTNLGVYPATTRTNATKIDQCKIPWKYLHKSLKETIAYHLEVINIANEMENVFSFLFLVILFYTTIILCFMVYRLSMLPLSDPEAVTYIVEIVFYSLQVAILCFWGEQVTHESEQVARAAYEADFVGTDLRFQGGLMLIIRRSQYPTKITAAKFTDIRLATFVWIIRATYSSFMLLRSIQGKENI